MINKKGQVQTLAPAILALVFAAIVLVFGIIITQSLTDTTKGDVSVSIANETIAAFAGTVNITIDGAGKCGFGTASNFVLYNESNNAIQTVTTDYIAYPDGNIVNASTTFSQYESKVSYDYTWGDIACEAGNNTTQGLGTFADFWEIIVLAIVITVVIGLLLIVFGGGRRPR